MNWRNDAGDDQTLLTPSTADCKYCWSGDSSGICGASGQGTTEAPSNSRKKI